MSFCYIFITLEVIFADSLFVLNKVHGVDSIERPFTPTTRWGIFFYKKKTLYLFQ